MHPTMRQIPGIIGFREELTKYLQRVFDARNDIATDQLCIVPRTGIINAHYVVITVIIITDIAIIFFDSVTNVIILVAVAAVAAVVDVSNPLMTIVVY